MISQSLLARIYEAASIQRWNDHVRPVDLTELDKQAHKMVIAYVLAKAEEVSGRPVEWELLIEGGIFELLQRAVLTDIKPPVFHRMYARHKKQIDKYVITELDGALKETNEDLRDRFISYFEIVRSTSLERQILRAAHYLATQWEFKIIYHAAPFIYGIDQTKREIDHEIEDHFDLVGVQKINLKQKSYGFVDLCGQLRFQQRWAQSPRVPKTSVLGHMLVVGILGYLCGIDLGACGKRKYNAFFGGLFHDLPEVLTRDIISPIKKSVDELDRTIKSYEKELMEERLLPLLPPDVRDEVVYLTEQEFDDRVLVDGETRKTTTKEMSEKYNSDGYRPVDGSVLKACDQLAAFMEASLSISHGISSRHLRNGKAALLKANEDQTIEALDFGRLYKQIAQGFAS